MRRTFLFSATLATVVATLPGAAQATSTTCSTSAVCAEYINTYSGSSGGVAIHGEADSGIGVRGTSVTNSGFYGASGSGAFTAPGVEGESTNVTGNDAAAAFGLSTFSNGPPTYGVLSYAENFGVEGIVVGSAKSVSSAGIGVYAFDPTGSKYNIAVKGVSSSGTGLLAEANGMPSAGIIGTAPIGVYGVGNQVQTGSLDPGVGVFGESNFAPIVAENTTQKIAVDIGSQSYLIEGGGSKALSQVDFSVDDGGNEILTGSLMTSKGTYARTAGRSGTSRIAYGTRSTAPEIEDVGEGTLTNGRAVVTIDADFADTIDLSRAYHVFLTPEGECNGLYVTQKTPGSFVVRELHAGRSSLSFDYRIVAKPADENGRRLALAAPLPRMPAFPHDAASASTSPPLLPQQRLERSLGERGYLKAMAELENRQAGR